MSAVMPKEAPLPVVASAATILQVIQSAAQNPAVDIEKMERLLAMHERIVAREAEAAFNDALAECQSEVRRVAPDALNSQTHSRYATYPALDKMLRPIYSARGFAISYDTGESRHEGYLLVLAHVSKGGHTRTYKIDMPADGKGAKGGDVMTKTHAVGAAMQYGMRYLLKAIFNVAIGELDKDGNNPPAVEADPEGKKKLEACASLDGLKKAWNELTAKQRSTLGKVKEDCKVRIETAEREAQK
jgi:hypothetical protein